MIEKLVFYPPPHEDELFSGANGRYHSRSVNLSYKATMKDLFGSETACAVVDFPNRLDNLYMRLPEGSLLTPDRIVDKNTMLPLYRRFLPKERVEKILSWMKGSGKGGSIHMAVGVTASTVPHPQYLRYCLECLVQDEYEVGEPYLHRSHQVAGVLVCHIHGSWLWETEFSITSPQNKHVFYILPRAELCHQNRPLHREESQKGQYLAIASSVAWLLQSTNRSVPGLGWLKNRYHYFLRAADIATFTGRVHQGELLERFNAHHGVRFLDGINCAVDAQAGDNWLSKLVRKPRTTAHPLKHILLMGFLEVGVERFFEEKVTKSPPFGRGPWPCLNPVSEHYRKPVIDHCDITTNSENGRPVGNFACRCGFCYARTGPDLERSDRFRVGKMIQYGPVWESELRKCEAAGKGLRETARCLGVCTKTVKRYLERQTVELSELPACSGFDNELTDRRARWTGLRLAFPDAGRKALRSLAQSDYTWLYRHDLEWLYKNMPPPMPSMRSSQSRVNWAQRDWRLASKVVAAAKNLRSMVDKPVRVTVSAVGKAMGTLFLLQNRLGKLPHTEQQLRIACEDRDRFDLRRVKLAVERLGVEMVPLEVWRVVRAANLRPGYSKAVQLEIERMVIKSHFTL
jgi:hypothetical protein